MRTTNIAATLVLCFGSAAQAELKDAINRANALLDQRNWYPALRLLENERPACASAPQPAQCEAQVDFALAFARQRAASEDPGETSVGLFRGALKAYDAVLKQLPDNPDALKNKALVEREIGEVDLATASLRRLVHIDAANAVSYLVVIGDMQRDQGNRAQAKATYREAADLAPGNELPWARLLSLELDSPGDGLRPLASTLRERGYAPLALSALEALIRHSPTARDQAIVEWVELQASRGTLSEPQLKGLGHPDWAAVRQLGAVLQDPIGPSPSWWQQTPTRRHAIAAALNHAAREALSNAKPDHAAKILERALAVTPDIPDYSVVSELRGKSNVTVDIALQLARVYHLHPALDPAHSRFRRLEDELFGEKATAYLRQDSAAIQRMHTVLGLIYAERDVWSGGYYKNATFQLENAIRAAERRRSAAMPGENVQPVPHLHALLAKHHREAGNPGAAAPYLVNAAAGYLDLDDGKAAMDALEQAGTTLPRAQSLLRIARTRRSIDALPSESFDPASTAAFSKSQEFRWLTGPLDGLDGSFLDRQRFKAVSDLGSRAEELGLTRAARELHLRAFDFARGQTALPSASDVLRLEATKRAVLSTVDIHSSPGLTATGPNLIRSSPWREGKVWMLPGESEAASQLGWSGTLVVGRDTAWALSRSTIRWSRISLADRKVTLAVDSDAIGSPEVSAKVAELRKIPGVATIDVVASARDQP